MVKERHKTCPKGLRAICHICVVLPRNPMWATGKCDDSQQITCNLAPCPRHNGSVGQIMPRWNSSLKTLKRNPEQCRNVRVPWKVRTFSESIISVPNLTGPTFNIWSRPHCNKYKDYVLAKFRQYFIHFVERRCNDIHSIVQIKGKKSSTKNPKCAIFRDTNKLKKSNK